MRIPASYALDLKIDGEHQGRTLCCTCTRDELLVKAAIALLHRLVHVLDRADRHRAHAIGNAEGLRGARAVDLPIAMKQARQSGRRDAQRYRHGLS